MTDKLAEDIMIPLEKYPHIPHWFTLRQAIAEIENAEIEINGRKSLPRALLVFDERYQLLGIVRRRDILRGLEPTFAHESAKTQRKLFDVDVDPDLLELSYTQDPEAFRKQAEQPISVVTKPIAATVSYDSHLAKIIHIMVNEDLHLLPVVKDNRVVGVVRSADVFHEVGKLLL
ncbi:MAG TPA: CBS domain-containing protein [candidate division Zixibacteria bacterium]|nr:CBS domain-containing protein [candidate division Zixibacteria bacterium]